MGTITWLQALFRGYLFAMVLSLPVFTGLDLIMTGHHAMVVTVILVWPAMFVLSFWLRGRDHPPKDQAATAPTSPVKEVKPYVIHVIHSDDRS